MTSVSNPRPKTIVDLGLNIKTHLCKSCVHHFNVCEELQYAYGSGEGSQEGMPNICACDGFDPIVVGRRKRDGEINKLAISKLRSGIDAY